MIATLGLHALPLVLSPAAGGGEGDDGWLDLDRRIEALDAPAQASAGGGARWGGLLRAFYAHADEETSTDVGDVSGQLFEDVDLHFQRLEGELDWRVSVELDSGEVRLEDGWARWRYAPWLGLLAGQFKPRVVRSGSVQPESLLFRERTFLGAAFDHWDDGLELGGHYDQFDYWLALGDGSNGSEKDHFWSARIEWAFFDEALPDREGAHDAPDHLRVLLGGFLFSDVALSSSKGNGFGGDLALTFGPYAFHGEWAALDEEFTRSAEVLNGISILIGDGSPLSATLSRRLGFGWEAAARWQRADDELDTEGYGVALDRSTSSAGARWVLDATRVESDDLDSWLFSVGLNAGSSGLAARPFLER
jgi:hypothetical protein